MKFKDFNQRVALLSADNRTLRVSNIFLAVCLCMCLFMLTKKNETIILLPPKLDRPIKVSNNLADKGYKELWAISIAQMAGNVTPKTVQFIADNITGFLSSDVYHKVAAELGSTVYKIQQEGRTTRFVPRRVAYEEETDKVFVEGDYFVTTKNAPFGRGRNGKEIPRKKVYEFVIDVSNGRPDVKHFVTYLGEMRDIAWVARDAAIKNKAGVNK